MRVYDLLDACGLVESASPFPHLPFFFFFFTIFFLTFSSPFLSPSFFLFLLASEMLRDPVNEPEKKNPQIGQTTTDRYLTFATVCSE